MRRKKILVFLGILLAVLCAFLWMARNHMAEKETSEECKDGRSCSDTMRDDKNNFPQCNGSEGCRDYTQADFTENELNADTDVSADQNLLHKPYDIREIISKKGVKAVYIEQKNAPEVSVSFTFAQAGRAYEPQKGLSRLAAEVLNLEAAGQVPDEDSGKVKNNFSFKSNRNDLSGNFVVPQTDFMSAAASLADILQQDDLDENIINRARERILEADVLRATKRSSIFEDYFNQKFFHEPVEESNIAYAYPAFGLISNNQIQAFLEQKLAKDNLYVAVVGDLTPQELETGLDMMFGSLKNSAQESFQDQPLVTYEPGIKYLSPALSFIEGRGISVGPKIGSDDFDAFYIAAFLFADQFSDEHIKGLSPDEFELNIAIKYHIPETSLMMNFEMAAEAYEPFMAYFNQIWQKMSKGQFGPQEFENAKEQVILSYQNGMMSVKKLSELLIAVHQSALNPDFINQREKLVQTLTYEQVKAAAEKYFKQKPTMLVTTPTLEEMSSPDVVNTEAF